LTLPSLLIRNATVVTMNDRFDVVSGAVSVHDGRIAGIGRVDESGHDRTIDARGGVLLPGFIQTHVHLCQTIFRGYADDLSLMDWRDAACGRWKPRIHPPLRASTELAAVTAPVGTTGVLTMETVRYRRFRDSPGSVCARRSASA
jgi:cytosine/adenosine deaminase-related metal-dependent hydrolase